MVSPRQSPGWVLCKKPVKCLVVLWTRILFIFGKPDPQPHQMKIRIPNPHQSDQLNPEPHQFANDKQKKYEKYEPI
jgi:hypothetical protein